MIQKFLTRIGFFIAILLLVILILLFAGSFFSRQKADFVIRDKSRSVLAIGNSHITYALNEKILNQLLNYGSDGEAYFYSYTKAKKLLEANPEIRYLLIGFSNNMIRNSIQRWYEEESFIAHHLPKYVNWMEAEDLQLIYKQNPKAFILSSSKFIGFDLKAWSGAKQFPVADWGGPKTLTTQLSDSVQNSNNLMNAYETGIHQTNVRYLQKMVEMAKSKKVQPIFVRTPVHKLYKVDNENDLNSVYQKYFSDIRFLDYQHLPLADSCFSDFDHLNVKGAEIFSQALKEELDKIVQ